ncbi:hypothetical protein F383_25965 [Gossypium arboreum]|uniref:Uncharacterized protein n=1 Tax=Gossypium arboreum TaxID=29729 RepID=A0A0B0MPG0_GOSAR|nr:hypothetical protein F383_25965 [Gossypium arboreum]
MKDIKAIVSSRIVEVHHHTIESHFGSSMAKAHGCVASRVAQVRLDHGQGTQAYLVAM